MTGIGLAATGEAWPEVSDSRPSSPPSRWPRRAALGLLAALVGLGILGGMVELGKLAIYRPTFALLLAAGAVVLAVAATRPQAMAATAVLGVWLTQRVSAGGIDISASDALLAMGAVAAFPHVPWHDQRLRRVITAAVAFEAVLFVTVLVHPTSRGLFEWGHRLFLVGGSIVVGAAVVHRGYLRLVVRTFLLVAAVVGTGMVIASAARGFADGGMLMYHKNYVGAMMLVALALAYLIPKETGLSSHELWVVKSTCAAGLLASQSRGAIVSLLVGLVVACLASRSLVRQLAPLFIVAIPLAVFAFISLKEQIERPADAPPNSSITERARYRNQALEAWKASPIAGQGMRFFQSGEFALDSDPHNVVMASLSETGIIGLAALVGLLGTACATLWRLKRGLAVAAVSILVARFVHGLLDIYWVASTQAIPWMIVGMALAQAAGQPQPAPRMRAAAEPALR